MHPDERFLPGYIGQLQTAASVAQLADWLKDNYPETASRLRSELKKRFNDLRKQGSIL